MGERPTARVAAQMDRSLTGATELDREATIISTYGHNSRALQLNRRALKIRLHHLVLSPVYSSDRRRRFPSRCRWRFGQDP